MKKLLIAVSAAACALGASATSATLPSGVTFEETGYTAGTALSLTNDDAGAELGTKEGQSQNGKWYSAGTVDATVTAYETAPAEGNNKYLNIDSASSPLYRLINGSAKPNVSTAATEGMGGVYIDTMVQFTAGDQVMSAVDPEAKLAIWVCGNDENGNPAATTNFLAQVGCFVDGVFTNKTITLSGVTYVPEKWYRLVVKTIANVGSDSLGTPYQGFVVTLDGTILTPSETLPDTDTLTGGVYDTKFAGKILLSMKEDNSKVAAVGFAGTGAIDTINFTAEAPIEDLADAQQYLLAAWDDEKVLNVTCGGAAVEPGMYDVSDSALTFSAEAVAGSVLVWKTNGVAYATGPESITVTLVKGDTLAIETIEPGAAVTIGGVTAYYADLNDLDAALTGQTSASVKLWADLKGILMLKTEGASIELDLAGKTLTGVNPAAIISAANITIIDTVGTGCVDGTILMQQGAALTLAGGKFLTTGLANTGYTVADGKEAVAEGDYTKIVDEVEKTDISAAVVTLSATDATYGDVTAPTVASVVLGETTLDAATDYNVTIPEITNAGEYTITVTGKGVYEGTATATFTVAPKTFTPVLTLSATSGVLGTEGLALPTVTVADGEAALNEANYDTAWSPAEITAAGDYVVTVTLKGNYSGSATATFTVTAPAPAGPTVGGDTVDADTVFNKANSQNGIVFPAGSKVAVVEGKITVGGEVFAAVPEYYTAEVVDGTTVNLTLNQKAIPEIGEAEVGEESKPAIEVGDDGFKLTIKGTKTGWFYRLIWADTPNAETWTDDTDWVSGDGANKQLPAAKGTNGRFYKIQVKDHK